MNYYRYSPNSNVFNGVYLQDDGRDIVGIHYVDGIQLKDWRPAKIREFDSDHPEVGDFPSLRAHYQMPVFSKHAWKTLEDTIGYCCEALPLEHDGPQYYLIHVMDAIDCLAEDESEVVRYSNGRIMRVLRYALKTELLHGKHIFKLPVESGHDLLVDDCFRGIVESSGLRGLEFRAIPLAKART